MSDIVYMAKLKLEDATMRARRSGEMFRDGAGAEMSLAYEEWMQSRAATGDTFALSLGYVGDGTWSLAAWIENKRERK